jgi:hypothetical protein
MNNLTWEPYIDGNQSHVTRFGIVGDVYRIRLDAKTVNHDALVPPKTDRSPVAYGLARRVVADRRRGAVRLAQSQPMNHATTVLSMHDGGMNLDTNDCGPVTAVSCQLPDLQSPWQPRWAT